LGNPLSPAELDRAMAAWEGKSGGVLRAVSAKEGHNLSTYALETPPVWDGMAAANGRLFVSLTGGQVQCWGQK
jgi:hypothetical protein